MSSISCDKTKDYSNKNFFGRCKWFNSKSGYGFITITYDDGTTGDDIFVHHNSIKVSNEQYKYLVVGEYVQFKIVESTDGKHKYYADEVCGIRGGNLMCETRREIRNTRNSYNKTQKNGEENVCESDDTWNHVSKNEKPYKRTNLKIEKKTKST